MFYGRILSELQFHYATLHFVIYMYQFCFADGPLFYLHGLGEWSGNGKAIQALDQFKNRNKCWVHQLVIMSPLTN